MTESIYTPSKSYEPGVSEAGNHVQAPISTALLDALLVLTRRRRQIGKVVLLFLAGALLWGLAAPSWYTARAKLLPPKQNQSMENLMMGQFSALSGLAPAELSFRDPNDMYVAMLKSRSVTEQIARRFDLQSRYNEKTMDGTLKKLAKHADITSGMDQIITIEVEDKDPVVASQIANAYVSEFAKVSSRTLMTSASQKRVFLQQQLQQAHEDLANAEAKLKAIQEKTGLIEISGQTFAIIQDVAALRARVGAAEVRLRTMNAFATPQNPDYVRAQQELAALRAQLAESERGTVRGGGDTSLPTGKIPSAGLEYLRQFREVKYRELLVEAITKEFEVARLDEVNTLSVAQVLDPAIPPEKKSWPRYWLMLVLALIAGCCVGITVAFVSEGLQSLEQDAESASRLQLLREQFGQFKRLRRLTRWASLSRWL